MVRLCLIQAIHWYRVLRMSEGDWLEVCDGRGCVVEAQLRGMTYSQQAFATAVSDVQQVYYMRFLSFGHAPDCGLAH